MFLSSCKMILAAGDRVASQQSVPSSKGRCVCLSLRDTCRDHLHIRPCIGVLICPWIMWEVHAIYMLCKIGLICFQLAFSDNQFFPINSKLLVLTLLWYVNCVDSWNWKSPAAHEFDAWEFRLWAYSTTAFRCSKLSSSQWASAKWWLP